jgi:hypothetical protein
MVAVVMIEGASSGVVDVTVLVAVDSSMGAAASNAAPTMIRFTAALAARIAPMIRRVVIRMQIFFSQCIAGSYSSDLGS